MGLREPGDGLGCGAEVKTLLLELLPELAAPIVSAGEERNGRCPRSLSISGALRLSGGAPAARGHGALGGESRRVRRLGSSIAVAHLAHRQQLGADLLLDLVSHFPVLLQEGPGVVLALADPAALVRIPG